MKTLQFVLFLFISHTVIAQQWQLSYVNGIKSAPPRDMFAVKAKVAGDHVLIGIPWGEMYSTTPIDSLTGINGVVYHYKRGEVIGWQECQTLKSPDADLLDFFGAAIAIDQGTLVIGAPGSGSDELPRKGVFGGGAIYIYEEGRDGLFSLLQCITSPNGKQGGGFGFAVAIEGDDLLVSATDVVYAYQRSADGKWKNAGQLKLKSGNHQNFGCSLALEGNYAVVGANGYDSESLEGENHGAAYLFKREGYGAWRLLKRLSLEESTSGAAFGSAVAFADRVIAISAPNIQLKDQNSVTAHDGGAIYSYRIGPEDQVKAYDPILPIADAAVGKVGNFGISIDLIDNLLLTGGWFLNSSTGGTAPPIGTLGCVYSIANGKAWETKQILATAKNKNRTLMVEAAAIDEGTLVLLQRATEKDSNKVQIWIFEK
jgi:hypothetical protein